MVMCIYIYSSVIAPRICVRSSLKRTTRENLRPSDGLPPLMSSPDHFAAFQRAPSRVSRTVLFYFYFLPNGGYQPPLIFSSLIFFSSFPSFSSLFLMFPNDTIIEGHWRKVERRNRECGGIKGDGRMMIVNDWIMKR